MRLQNGAGQLPPLWLVYASHPHSIHLLTSDATPLHHHVDRHTTCLVAVRLPRVTMFSHLHHLHLILFALFSCSRRHSDCDYQKYGKLNATDALVVHSSPSALGRKEKLYQQLPACACPTARLAPSALLCFNPSCTRCRQCCLLRIRLYALSYCGLHTLDRQGPAAIPSMPHLVSLTLTSSLVSP
jgi:hypothetical protein